MKGTLYITGDADADELSTPTRSHSFSACCSTSTFSNHVVARTSLRHLP